MKAIATKDNITDYGLQFFFSIAKDLTLSREVIQVLYQVIVAIVMTKPESLQEVPEVPGPDDEGNEPSEEDKAAVIKQIDAITHQN